MKMMQKRILSMVLVCIMALGVFAGCVQEPAKPDASTSTDSKPTESHPENNDPFHITDEHVDYTAACGIIPSWGDLNNKPAFQDLEQKTNVHLQFTTYMSDVASERVSLLMSSDPMPDCFWGHENFKPRSTAIQYGKEGLLIDLKPLLKEYAPHVTAVYDKYDLWRKYEDGEGHMYTLATANVSRWSPKEYPNIDVEVAQFINTDYLKQVGKDMPTTNDELFEALKAIKQLKTPDGLEIYPLSWGRPYQLGAQLPCNFGYNPSIPCGLQYDGQKIYRGGDSDNYKEFLKFMNKLWENKLIDPEVFTHDPATYRAKCAAGQVACFAAFGGWNEVGVENIENGTYACLPPFPGPDGKCLSSNSGLRQLNRDSCDFAITKDCKNPIPLIKFVDLFYNDDLVVAFEQDSGLEGVSWDYDENGMIQKHEVPEGFGSWGQYRCSMVVPCGPNSWGPKLLAKIPFDGQAKLFSDVKLKAGYFEAAKNDHPLPLLSFTSDEIEEMTVLRTDLDDYFTHFEAECITGQKDIEAVWEGHIAELDKLGYDRLIEIYNDALERYNR